MTMQSVGMTTSQPGGNTPASAGVLHTQLDRFETQLADWCNCPSGKTQHGKRIIAELTQKAAIVREQIKRVEVERAPQVQAQAQAPAQSPLPAAGARLDVYA